MRAAKGRKNSRGASARSGAAVRAGRPGPRGALETSRHTRGASAGFLGTPVFTPAEEFTATWRKFRREIVLACLGLTVLTFLAFGRAGSYGFIDMDDPQEIYENPHVKDGFVPGAVEWAFEETKSYYWEPLTSLSHMLDCQFFGLNAGAHHLVSVGLHGLNASLVFLMLLYMTGSLWPSAFVAAVFALHPLRVESVVWLSERRDVLSGLFSILTLWLYAWYVRRPGSWKRYGAVFLAFWLALMSKPMAVTIPAVMLVLDFWPFERLRRETALKLLVEKIPLFVPAAVISAVTIGSKTGQAISSDGLPLIVRISSVFTQYAAYLGKLLWPVPLAVLYPYVHPAPIAAAAAGLSFVLLSALAVRHARGSPWLLAGWLWFLITMLPVIGIALVADRFTYLGLIGPSIAVVWLVSGWLPSRPRLRPLSIGSAVILLLGLGALSWRQTGFWKDSLSLFSHSIAVTQDNWPTMNRYAGSLAMAGRLDEAVQNYRQAIRLKPSEVESREAMAEVLERQGNTAEAVAEYRQVIAMKPENVDALKHLSLALIRSGSYDEALAYLRNASRLAPDDPGIAQLLAAFGGVRER